MLPATAKWYDRRDFVFVEFCVSDAKDIKVNFDKTKLGFSCVGPDNTKLENQIDLFDNINEKESTHKCTDRSISCFLQKANPGTAWPRLTIEKAKVSWLSVDFNNWKNWDDDSEEEMMRRENGDDELTDDEDTSDSDDNELPDLE